MRSFVKTTRKSMEIRRNGERQRAARVENTAIKRNRNRISVKLRINRSTWPKRMHEMHSAKLTAKEGERKKL